MLIFFSQYAPTTAIGSKTLHSELSISLDRFEDFTTSGYIYNATTQDEGELKRDLKRAYFYGAVIH